MNQLTLSFENKQTKDAFLGWLKSFGAERFLYVNKDVPLVANSVDFEGDTVFFLANQPLTGINYENKEDLVNLVSNPYVNANGQLVRTEVTESGVSTEVPVSEVEASTEFNAFCSEGNLTATDVADGENNG